MTHKVVLFGDGQIASSAYWHLTHDSPFEVVGFTVDGAYQRFERLFDLPMVAFEDVQARFPPDDYRMFVTISFQAVNRLRVRKYEQAKAMGYQLINYISTHAITWPGLVMGDNCYVRTAAIIEPFARLGSNVVVGTAATIGHHTVIGDHSYLAINATVAGSVVVGERCLLGANCTIRDGISIGSASIIGAGATILQNTVAGEVYKAQPAERLPISSDELRTI